MDLLTRPWRSVLYIPGSNARALEKAKGLAVDAIIFDLEDAVAPDEKGAARQLLADTLGAGGYGARAGMVRINGFDSDWWEDDLAVISAAKPDAILLPKVGSASDIKRLSDKLDQYPGMEETRIWAMMETPEGIRNAFDVAAAPRMAGFILGTNDLAKEINCQFRADRLPLMMALQTCLMAARAAGIICIDGVYNAFKDEDGLKAECEQGRDLGMDGKSLIHPAQVAVTNDVFAPSLDEIELARRQIQAFDDALANGQAVAVVDGRIVENLHVATAQTILAKADAIEAMEAA
jgi:(3S)-malyl-CoA thioesterase